MEEKILSTRQERLLFPHKYWVKTDTVEALLQGYLQRLTEKELREYNIYAGDPSLNREDRVRHLAYWFRANALDHGYELGKIGIKAKRALYSDGSLVHFTYTNDEYGDMWGENLTT